MELFSPGGCPIRWRKMPMMGVTGIEEVLVNARGIVKWVRVARTGSVTRYAQACPGKPDHYGFHKASARHPIGRDIIFPVYFQNFIPPISDGCLKFSIWNRNRRVKKNTLFRLSLRSRTRLGAVAPRELGGSLAGELCPVGALAHITARRTFIKSAPVSARRAGRFISLVA